MPVSPAAVGGADPVGAGPCALSGRAYLITGAAGGIGAGCALTLARRGADLVLADRDAAGLEPVAEAARASGAAVLTRRADVTDAAQCTELADRAVAAFPGLAGAVLAAGTARHAGIVDLEAAQWRAIIDLHLTGTFLCLQAIARVMAGSGSIVCLSSTVAEAGGPLRQAHYVAGKAGILGLVRAAARELGARGIRVNAVSPGFTDTGLNSGLFSRAEREQRAGRSALGRIATPRDIAGVVAFLLGADAAFVTGENIRVDGGARLS